MAIGNMHQKLVKDCRCVVQRYAHGQRETSTQTTQVTCTKNQLKTVDVQFRDMLMDKERQAHKHAHHNTAPLPGAE